MKKKICFYILAFSVWPFSLKLYGFGKYYINYNPKLKANELLQRFIKYKEDFSNINAKYKEAKELIERL